MTLTARGDHLLFEAPEGVMSDPLHTSIGAHKSALLDLMRRATRVSADAASQAVSDDDLPLTPNHAWYLDTFEPERHKWAITLAVDVPGQVSAERLREAISILLERHDVFRLRMRRTPEGVWSLRMLARTDNTQLAVHDLQSLTANTRADALHAAGFRLQSELSIVAGPVLAVALCRCGHDNGDTVIVSMHHHIVDGYSVSLLLQELFRTYHSGAEAAASSASYRDFLLGFHAYTHTPMFVSRALSFWQSGNRLRPLPPLPVDIPAGHHTDLSSRVLSITLESELLRKLASIGARHELRLNDLLLIALAQAYDRWSAGSPLRLDIEHNGRSGVVPGLNLLRTIGPTTIKFPMLLEVHDGDDPTDSMERLGREIRATTDNMLGYGMLRYTCPDIRIRDELASCAPARVFFNNHSALSGGGAIAMRAMAFPQPDVHENPVSYDLMLECDRCQDTLVLKWIYSNTIHREDTIGALAKSFASWLRALPG